MKRNLYIRKFMLLCLVIAIATQYTACANTSINGASSNAIGLKTQLPSLKGKTGTNETEKVEFIHSSLQEGFYLISDGRILTGIWDGAVFENKPVSGKYPLYKWLDNYLELDGGLFLDKVFNYYDKNIFIGKYTDKSTVCREIIIQNTLSKDKQFVRISLGGSTSYYILGSKLYFDEYDSNNSKYFIKNIDVNSLKEETVCMYNGNFKSGEFVLRGDGAIAFKIEDLQGVSHIFRYNNGVYKDIVTKRWCKLIDYDNRGIFLLIPDGTDEQLSNLKDGYFVSEYAFSVFSESGDIKVLLKRKGGDVGTFKVNNDYFIRISKSENTYYSDYVEKYDFQGNLIKKIPLKQWPILGKKVLTYSRVIYFNGSIYNLFNRRDTDELEVETIKLD